MSKNPYLWEVELAYLQREKNLRQIRAEAHLEYIKKFAPAAEVDSTLSSDVTLEVSTQNGLN
jgi:hypothetical protein